MTKNILFEFDKDMAEKSCHCEERQSLDAAIQKKELALLHSVRNDVIVIGTDEAGRGPGAGGVFASAVYFPNPDSGLIKNLSCLNDSKKISKKVREELYDIILENSINSTVCVEVEEIEKINILNASLKAMKLACENVIGLCPPPEGGPKLCSNFEGGILDTKIQSRVGLLSHQQNILVLVDGNKLIKNFDYPQQFVIKGDSKSASIAAASILAKVSRDRYMQELDRQFPQFNWKQNAGYLTPEHLRAIEEYGITPHHRKSFLKGRNTKQLSLLKS